MKNFLSLKNPKYLEIDSNLAFGFFGEDLVKNFLLKNNYTILTSNYRKKSGEIDIIAKKGNVIAFVEVKSRNATYFSNSEVIVQSKMKKIIKTAKIFIAEQRLHDCVYRFDVAIVEKTNTDFAINYIENAFCESYYD